MFSLFGTGRLSHEKDWQQRWVSRCLWTWWHMRGEQGKRGLWQEHPWGGTHQLLDLNDQAIPVALSCKSKRSQDNRFIFIVKEIRWQCNFCQGKLPVLGKALGIRPLISVAVCVGMFFCFDFCLQKSLLFLLTSTFYIKICLSDFPIAGLLVTTSTQRCRNWMISVFFLTFCFSACSSVLPSALWQGINKNPLQREHYMLLVWLVGAKLHIFAKANLLRNFFAQCHTIVFWATREFCMSVT